MGEYQPNRTTTPALGHDTLREHFELLQTTVPRNIEISTIPIGSYAHFTVCASYDWDLTLFGECFVRAPGELLL